MIKKIIALCLLLMLPVVSFAENAEEKELPIYYTTAAKEFHLRAEIESDKRVVKVSPQTKVDVYETSGDWCRVSVRGKEGWCKVSWLNFIKSVHVDQKTPRYEAITAREFTIFLEPNSKRSLRKTEKEKFITVYEYGEEWCQVFWEDILGWCKTDMLWGFRSLDAEKYPVPGVQPNAGVVLLSRDTWIDSDDFDGMNAPAGSLVCVRSAGEGEYTLPVWRKEGKIPAENGQMMPFAAWQEARPGDVIGGFTTFYDADYGADLAEGRAYNIDLACQRIDDVVLQPGERFSYNDLCAPYKVSNGYKMAPNISAKGQGYGGGVCQVTTTLYNALIPLPLQIDEWRVHQKTGVVYIPQYFDAAVGSFYDLIFRNTLPYPIRIEAMPQSGAVTVLLYRAE